MVTAYVGLGSNLGDRGANILTALAELGNTEGCKIGAVSSMLDNPAVGGPEGAPPFLNAVAEVRTTVPPRELLARLLEIERDMGRVRREKWEPRVIDLDLLLYGDAIVSSDDLVIPHPLMHERRFVLGPLAELAPDLVHPAMRMTMKGLLEALREKAPSA